MPDRYLPRPASFYDGPDNTIPGYYRRHWSQEGQALLSTINWWLTVLPRMIAETTADVGAENVPLFLADHREDVTGNTLDSRERVHQVLRLLAAKDAAGLRTFLIPYSFRFIPYFPSWDGQSGNVVLSYFATNSALPSRECDAILAAVRLASSGLLERLQTCPVCDLLFYPTRGGQRQCTTKCSRIAHDSTDIAKERRRAAARRQYDKDNPVAKRARKPRSASHDFSPVSPEAQA